MDTSEALNIVGRFAAPLVTRPDMLPADRIRLASAFAAVAEEILKAVGGNEMAASLFYAIADRLAVKRDS